MPIIFKQKVAALDGNCEIDLAEELDLWLAENPKRQVNLKKLPHAHTALYQVLIKHQTGISVWPEAGAWGWLKRAIDAGLYNAESQA